MASVFQRLFKFGQHRFNVNTQSFELTMVPREGEMHIHLTGTDFFERIDDFVCAQFACFVASPGVDIYGDYARAKVFAVDYAPKSHGAKARDHECVVGIYLHALYGAKCGA